LPGALGVKLLMCFVTPLPALPVRFTAHNRETETKTQGGMMRHQREIGLGNRGNSDRV
jgi:hypothetical protein